MIKLTKKRMLDLAQAGARAKSNTYKEMWKETGCTNCLKWANEYLDLSNRLLEEYNNLAE